MPPSLIPENRSARVSMMLRNNKNTNTKKLNRGKGSRNLLGKTVSNTKPLAPKNNAIQKNKGIPLSSLYGTRPTKANSNAVNTALTKTTKLGRNNVNRMRRMVAYKLVNLEK